MSEQYGSLRVCSWSSFLFGFRILFGLVNNSSVVSEDCRSLRFCPATFSLDTIEDVTGGEVDEFEEDVG